MPFEVTDRDSWAVRAYLSWFSSDDARYQTITIDTNLKWDTTWDWAITVG